MAHTEQDGGGWASDVLLVGANGLGSIVSSPAPWKAIEEVCYALDNVTVYTDTRSLNGIGTDWVTMSFHVRFANITSDSFYTFAKAFCGTGLSWYANVINSSGDVRFYDSGGATIGTISGAVTIDTWYRVTVKYSNQNSTAFRVWWSAAASEHGSPSIDATGADCYSGTSTDAVYLRFNNDINPSLGLSVYFGAWLIRSDNGAAISTNTTQPRPYWFRRYQWDRTGTTADWGTTLDAGSWPNANELPKNDSNYARYSGSALKEGGVSCDDATNGGPNGDPNIGTGTILWATWAWRWYAQSGITRPRWYGVYGAAASPGDPGNDTPNQTGTGAFLTYAVRSRSGETGFPTTSQYMQIGFGHYNTGGVGNVDSGEMYACVLYEEPATATYRNVCIDGLVIEVT